MTNEQAKDLMARVIAGTRGIPDSTYEEGLMKAVSILQVGIDMMVILLGNKGTAELLYADADKLATKDLTIKT